MAYVLIPGRFNTAPSGAVRLRLNSDIMRGVQFATSPLGVGPRRLLDMLHGKTYTTVTGTGTKAGNGFSASSHVINSADYFSLPFDPAPFAAGKITVVSPVNVTAAAGQRGYLHIGTADIFTPALLLEQSSANFQAYHTGAFRLTGTNVFASLRARVGFSQSAGTSRCYSNGVLVSSGSHPDPVFTGATQLWVGGGYEYPVTGTVGEMLVWNRALSAAEHAALAREWYGLIYEQDPRRISVAAGAPPSSVSTEVSPAAVTVAGQTVNTQLTFSTPVAPVGFTLSGQTIGSVATSGASTLVSPAALVLTGQSIGSLVASAASTSVSPAAFAITGASLTLVYTQSAIVSPAAFVVSPQNVNSVATAANVLSVAPASFAITPQALGSGATFSTPVSPSALSVSGQALLTQWSQSTGLIPASFAVSGKVLNSLVTSGGATLVSPAAFVISPRSVLTIWSEVSSLPARLGVRPIHAKLRVITSYARLRARHSFLNLE